MVEQDKLKIVPSVEEPQPTQTSAAQSEADKRDETRDEIEDLIASFTEQDDAWKVSVYRLRGIGRTDSASPRAFLATLPVTEDLLDVLQTMFGEGDYSLEFKQRGKIKKKGTVAIAPLPQVEQTDDADLDDESDESAEVSEHARRLERLEALMLELVEQRREPQPPQVLPVKPDPAAPLRDALAMVREFQVFNAQINPPPAAPVAQADDEEKALLMLLKDSSLRSRVASSLNSLISNEQPEKTMLDSVVSIFQNPAIATRALDVVANIAARVLPSPAQQPPAVAPTMPPTIAASEASDAPEGEPEDAPEDDEPVTSEEMIVKLLGDLVAHAPVNESAEYVREIIRDYPANAGTFAAFMNMPADAVLGMVTQNIEGGAEIVKLPHARKWLEALQSRLKQSHKSVDG
jgi:hypothetical protein